MYYPKLDKKIHRALLDGCVIPAHPLALNKNREPDFYRQKMLTRYYLDAGAGGIAVGVHTTQFEIRNKEFSLLGPVLQMASEAIDHARPDRPFIRVAGICGPADQALAEAELAIASGYHLGLVSMGGLADYSDDQLLDRTRQIAGVIPIFGFYLQDAVGGRDLNYDFWKEFVSIPNVYAIKLAPFNRYKSLDVVRATAESERRDEIALYTGNDDHIILDLLTPFRIWVNGSYVEKRMVGGLLGQWAVWTSKAVELLHQIKSLGDEIPGSFLTLDAHLTDANGAIFDAANKFHGCIPGIHEILRRQGLLEGIWCLNDNEILSEGQTEDIDRISKSYPHLSDNEFVSKWLSRQGKKE